MRNLLLIDNIFLVGCGFLCITFLIFLLRSIKKNKELSDSIATYKNAAGNNNEIETRIFIAIRHDVISVVNALNSFGRLMQFDDLSLTERQEYIEDLKRTFRDNKFLMENLVYLGNIQIEDFKPIIENFDLKLRVDEVIDSLSEMAARKKINIVNNLMNETLVLADVPMTELVLKNCIHNAIKYSYNGGTIDISSDTQNPHIRLKIRDCGSGIEPAMAENFNTSSLHYFKRNPGTQNESGTGIGLLLCKILLKLMKGSIIVESLEGKGSMVSIFLLKGAI